jgi:DNA-binding GntR family transcriptional regulator
LTVDNQHEEGRVILEHVSLPEAVTRALRLRILNNELVAGSRLVEANLATEFGVSRATIRDAIRTLQAEGLIEIVPRRYSVVTRMSPADAEDICYARYVLEDASVSSGLPAQRKEVVKALRVALEHMALAGRLNDLDALAASDKHFHEVLIDLSGRRRLKDLWSMLNSQMGAVMRAELERQDIEMTHTVELHLGIVEAMADGDLPRLSAELRAHYLAGFPESPAGG